MVRWFFCVGLVILDILGILEAKLHYAVIFPSELHTQHPENICLQLEGAEGESKVKISLNLDNKDTTLIEKNFQQDTVFTCLKFKVPIHEVDESVGTLTLSIKSSGESITNTSKVLIKKKLSKILIQTDKAVYKPGQTVKFRILCLNEDFKPENILIPVVEVQDPDKNRISQWLNVNLNQGISELSLALSFEPRLGEYSIKLKDTSHIFSVEEYVLPKFEVDIHLPKYVLSISKQIPVEICGKYTYGKPVQGDFTASICREGYPPYFLWSIGPMSPNVPSICANFSGKLDRSGCHTIEVKTEIFRLKETEMNERMKNELKGAASVTEEGTGVELSSTSQTRITNVINIISFINADDNYKPGIPYTAAIKVEDAGGVPKSNITIYLKEIYGSTILPLVTDENGLASFTLNTSNWKDGQHLLAQSDLGVEFDLDFPRSTDYDGQATHIVVSFYSRSKSFLKLISLDNIPCEGYQEVLVEYIISHTELKKAKKLFMNYLLVSKVSIKDSGTVDIKIENTNEDIHGHVNLTLPISEATSNILHALVYILLPNGEMLADAAKLNVLNCLTKKVSAGFSPTEVLPGSDVSLQVQAAPGSLCGLRVVDKSVVLMKPEKELTADKVYDLFPIPSSHTYNKKVVDENRCKEKRYSLRHYKYYGENRRKEVDVCTYFENLSLKIITNANIKSRSRSMSRYYKTTSYSGSIDIIKMTMVKEDDDVSYSDNVVSNMIPSTEQESVIRHYFPETWIWKLEAVGDSGIAVLHDAAPDTITDWHGGAFCMGPAGFGLSPSTSFRVFQPFFVDITLLYSVIRGETFTLKATVFNYLKQCIKVRTTLWPSVELEERPCDDCQYSSCLCVDESKTFYWNLKASKLGQVNVTVTTAALDTQDLCNNEVPIVPKQGSIDMVVKPLLVQPGGVLEEKSYSALLCSQGEDDSKVEEISLKIPENILKDSERAYISVIGDLMGTAMQNLDRLLAMPYGCGEQNMVLFAPNIFVLQYLEKTHQLNSEIKHKATKFLESGYQRELTYKRDDGSYSAFGKNDQSGNTWLTAFVVKSFSKARPYIFIDENHLKHSFSWLKENQQANGCFRSVGRLFNNVMKGGVTDEISLSAYVTVSLLEAGASIEDPLVRNAVSCLKTEAGNVTNVYSQALLVYAFTLCGNTELREALMDKLEAQVIKGNRERHWERSSKPQPEDSYWSQAPSAEVELTSYVLLALLSGPTQDLVKASEIVNWLSKQQNPYGGFSSTQDTVVALQALAKYAEATFSDKGDVTVTVASKPEFMKQFHVNNNNRLLLQSTSLPTVPGEYMVRSSGSGCVYVQAVLRYNVPPPKQEDTFAIKVLTQSNECTVDPMTKLEIKITAQYTGSREKSNMVVIDVKMLSGYIPIKSTVRTLEKTKLIKRSDIQTDMVTLYLEELGRDSVNLSFFVEQDSEVKDLKPAIVKIYDYYETDEHAVAEYSSPCRG